ncbi:hypothetical protein [Limnoglobus roseus]|uniref:Uncharacterized protein n=1 Tax=Limnoglobus roseus TaxID=2598579 RepID=A0A5C1A786_9BACT|nr:hypothetical protein [Limnoglobus roseus]QEL13702.1 hypothetical protein PX52LOC_00560 [Limnoglobus roseus]
MTSCSTIAVLMVGLSNLSPPDILQARFFQLKQYSAEKAIVKLRRELGNDISIASDRESNRIFLRATSATFQQVETILNRLDVARPNCLLQFIRLKHVPASLACQTTDFLLLLLAVIDGDDDPIYLTPETRKNAAIMAGGTWDRWQQVAFFLHLFDRNLWGLYGNGWDYITR